eukprot:3254593-Lingulodinium_polyedra.AAC.1
MTLCVAAGYMVAMAALQQNYSWLPWPFSSIARVGAAWTHYTSTSIGWQRRWPSCVISGPGWALRRPA